MVVAGVYSSGYDLGAWGGCAGPGLGSPQTCSVLDVPHLCFMGSPGAGTSGRCLEWVQQLCDTGILAEDTAPGTLQGDMGQGKGL